MSQPEEHRPNPKLASSAFTQLVGAFKNRISGLFDQMVDVLLGMAEKTASVNDQHLYFDSMRSLRQSRGEIIEAFEQNLSSMGKDPDALEKLKPESSIDTLELVSDDTMNENVTLSNLAQRITNRAGDEINALDIRIDSISSDEDVMGISPEIALRALEAALRKSSLEFDTRQVVYQIIEQQAVHSFASVYAETNQWMINQGVMPRIPLGYVRRRDIGRRKNVIEAITMPSETEAEKPPLRSFEQDFGQNAGEDFSQAPQDVPSHAVSPLRHFNPDDETQHTGSAGYTPAGESPFNDMPHGTHPIAAHGFNAGADTFGTRDWPWNGDNREMHIPWLNQQLVKLQSHQQNPVAQAISHISPALNAAASHDLSILHDRRHPMRRALTLLEDLIIDLDSQDGLDDIGGEITQMISLMEARAASGPGFWLHVVKYLNYLKEELHGRLWSDDVDTNHQERVSLARRLATRQIQLMMRDKRVTPALQRILTQMLGPALAILMLRHRHDRDSHVLRNALQLIHDVIESIQDLPESLEDMHYLEHTSGKALIQQLHGFFMGFSGFDQQIVSESLLQLEQEHIHILSALQSRNNQVTLPMFSARIEHTNEDERSATLHLPALPSPLLVEEPEIAEFSENAPDKPVFESIAESIQESIQESASAPIMHDALVTPEATFIPSAAEDSPGMASVGNDNTPPVIEADLAALNNLALDALLEKLMREHRFTWFQVPACEGCNLRRLMFGAYDHARRLVMFCNVRQEPTLSISVVDFDLGLKNGSTRPLYDEPEITRLLKDYLKSCATSA